MYWVGEAPLSVRKTECCAPGVKVAEALTKAAPPVACVTLMMLACDGVTVP